MYQVLTCTVQQVLWERMHNKVFQRIVTFNSGEGKINDNERSTKYESLSIKKVFFCFFKLKGSWLADFFQQVVGDPFGATTHSDLFIRAREKGIQTRVVHNASIMNAIGCCGLQVFKFEKKGAPR